MAPSPAPIFETHCPDLKLLARGKVRDIYDFGDRLLLVVTDRLSAFDCVLPNPIPNKGHVLTYVSKHWFERTEDIIESHFISCDFSDFPAECAPYRDQLEGRSTLVRKTTPLPIECVARGYLHGSAFKEYKATGMVTGIPLPEGLDQQSRLPEPIFTPATKATDGHDENIPFERVVEILGEEDARFVRDITLQLYAFGHAAMAERGIALVDTKFEFGKTEDGRIILIDECMTPDSSRYYEAATYRPGNPSICYDKQLVRDYLETLDWDKTPPAPALPPEIVAGASERYTQLLDLLEGRIDILEGAPAAAATPMASTPAGGAGSLFQATVTVLLKPEVFDVQGQTILQALGHMRHDNVRRIRAGKTFVLDLEAESAEAAKAQLEKISHDLLSNPVIEEYQIELG